jgi:intraflagellar transport protein 52
LFKDSEDLPRDHTRLFEKKLFSINFNLVPESLRLFKQLNIKHEPLSLIPPTFETPMLGLVPAVFPPILAELNPPRLELFDLDDEFSDQM